MDRNMTECNEKEKLHHSKSRCYKRETSFCVCNAQQFSFLTLTAMQTDRQSANSEAVHKPDKGC